MDTMDLVQTMANDLHSVAESLKAIEALLVSLLRTSMVVLGVVVVMAVRQK